MPQTSKHKSAFDLQECARKNILALQPYRCARDDYKDDGTNILLDANENAYGPGLDLPEDGKVVIENSNGHSNVKRAVGITELNLKGLNRYPDPHQHDLKQRLCTLRNTHTHTPKTLTPANLFMGVGSDEVIDALIRCFCVPGHDKILTCPPTYGMYAVSAQVNDIAIVHAPLAAKKDFAVQAELINEKLSADPSIKLVYICSPGNPTGTLASKDAIRKVLEHPTWNGVVVIDEAYIDFAPDGTSLAEWTTEWPNLVVMQTMSKAFGLAGIRLGAAFASPEIAQLLNNMKAPYNISNITSQIGQQALSEDHLNVMRSNRDRIMEQRHRLYQQLPTVPGIGNFRGGLASNFLLVEMLDKPGGEPSNEVALAVYETLAERKGVVVRFRGKELGCEGCLRITVGTESEVTRLLKEIAVVLSDIHAHQNHVTNGQKEETKEVMANDVVS